MAGRLTRLASMGCGTAMPACPDTPATSVGIGPSAANAGTEDIGVSSTSMSSNSAATRRTSCRLDSSTRASLGSVTVLVERQPGATSGSSSSSRCCQSSGAIADELVHALHPGVGGDVVLELDGAIDEREAGGLDEVVRGGAGQLGHLRFDDGEAEVARPRHPQPLDPLGPADDVEVAEAGRRQAGPVAVVRPGHHVEEQGGVGHGRRQRADDGVLGQVGDVEGGDPPVAALQADESGEAGRGADRPAAVARRAERHHAGRDGGAGAAARAARRPGRVPRVAGDAEGRARGVRPGAELGRRGLADGDGAGGAQPGDVDGVALDGRPAREPARAPRRRHAGAVLEVLHAEGHPRQRPERVGPTCGQLAIDGLGLRPRAVEVEVDERVELAVAVLDGLQAGPEQLRRRDVAAADEVRGLEGAGHLHGAPTVPTAHPTSGERADAAHCLQCTTNRYRGTAMVRARLRYEYVVAVVFVTGLFMEILDTTIVNVALPTLGGSSASAPRPSSGSSSATC